MAVSWLCPGSGAVPPDRQDSVAWARHGVIGGTAARAWGAYTLSGEQWCWTVRHGSGVDPRLDVDALAEALSGDHLAVVELTAGTDYSSEDVADAIAAALLSEFGHVASVAPETVDGVTRYRVTLSSATSGLVGAAAANAGVRSQCGMHDGSRYSGAGAVDGTLLNHVVVAAYHRDGTAVATGTRCRITGVGYFGLGGITPRLGVALGPAYSATPTGLGPVADAGVPASGPTNGYEPIIAWLPTALPCEIGDDAWILACSDGSTGTLGYRFNSEGTWFGDFSTSENLLVEDSRNTPGTPFPTSTWTPTISANFAVRSTVFLIVECDDDAGAGDGSGFAGDASLWVEWGCRRDAAGETPTEATPSGEAFSYRQLTPPMPRVAYHAVAYGLAGVSASEDMSAAFYSWNTLSLTSPSATRLGQSGLLGWDDGDVDEYNVAVLPARVPIGSDVVSDPYVSFGFVGGQIAGGAPSSLLIQFDTRAAEFGTDGEQIYSQGASPDLLVSDWVVGGLRELCEFVSFATSTMPYNAPAGTWPNPYDFGGPDVLPANLGRSYAVITEQSSTADRFAVTTSDEGASWEAGAALDLDASAETVVPAAWEAGAALELDAAASVSVGAAWTAGPRLGLTFAGAANGVSSVGDEVLPMPDLLSLLRGAAAQPGVVATNVAVNASDALLSPAPSGSARGAMVVLGCLTATEDTVVEFYDGDPSDAGDLLFAQPLTGGVPFPLQLAGLYSSGGRALWVRATEAVDVSGRSLTSEI